MRILCNESPRELPGSISVQELLDQMAMPTRGIAVAVNSVVVARSAWANRMLQEEDKVLIIQAAQGG